MLKKLFLNLSIEFGPIIVFLITSELLSFMTAVLIFVVLTSLSLIIAFLERRELAWFPLIVGVSVIGFGLLTIILNNPFFIIIKDTLYNGIFAAVLFIGLAFQKSLLQPLFRGLFAMTDAGWRMLTYRWAILFTILTVANEIARINLTAEDWVVYKGIATLVTIIFSLYQFRLSRKERLPESSPWGMRIIEKKA
ncbi:MAG: septation protein IspZ [Patescibacteria group bacterium]